MAPIATRRRLLFCSILCILLIGCDRPASNVEVETSKPGPNAPAPTVDLPPPPTKEDFIIEERHGDGTFRVQGLIEYKDKHLEEEVVVKGVVTSISPVCDPGKAKEEGTKCPEPHLVIRDDEAGAQKDLLVVGYPDDFIKRAKLKEGEVYDFKGTYQMMGRGFTASENGLLILAEANEEVVQEEE